MDPNKIVIDMVKRHFPGNDILFENMGDYYNIRINYGEPFRFATCGFGINVLDINFEKNATNLINKLYSIWGRQYQINLHPAMLKKIEYSPTFRNDSERVTVSGNPINYDEPIYIVLLEELLEVVDGGYQHLGLRVGYIQEQEFVDYYPVSIKVERGGKFSTIKRRNN
jgi:hypothetical protein